MMRTTIAQTLFFAATVPDWLRWNLSRRNPAAAQEKVLLKIIKTNANTEFGKQHGFSSIRSRADFQRQVPLGDYENFAGPVQRMVQGQARILCAEKPVLFEPTSGSTGKGKLVPYTPSLKREFLRGINPWLCDLYLHHPQLFGGTAYWQITPAVEVEQEGAGRSEGFNDDAEYLGRIAQSVWRRISAVPAELRKVTDPQTFRYLSALFLLRARDLRLISVWSPSFLLLLLETAVEHRASLVRDLALGGSACDPSGAWALPGLPERAAEVDQLLNSSQVCWPRVWPELAVLSCWTEGFAAQLIPELARNFEGVKIQGKGLLATEGIVSFPLSNQALGSIPAINSHFLEFCEAGSDHLHFIDELETGKRYSVVVTTGGGLYRYRLRDLIEITGFAERNPLLRFVGREHGVSDFFGEKLHEAHVNEAVTAALAAIEPRPQFALFGCEKIGGRFCYCLLLQTECLSERTEAAILDDIDARLTENIHYRYCRSLGQLGPLKLFYVKEHGLRRYVAELRKRGVPEGRIKPGLLAKGTGWLEPIVAPLLEGS